MGDEGAAARPARERAPAKVNLLLRVVGRRPDGYHRLVSVMAALDLADELVARRLPDAPEGWLRVRVEGPQAGRLQEAGTPLVEELHLGGTPLLRPANLVSRAALALARRVMDQAGRLPPATELVLTKRVPAAAGLGGGSSDAAAALRALVRLWGVGLAQAELHALAASLGADVPFFLRGGVQLACGVGEELTPLPSRLDAWYVLVAPDALISTQEAFRRWDLRPPAASPEQAAAEALRQARAMAEALARGELDAVAAAVGNDLEPVALALWPPLSAVLDALRRSSLAGVAVSGSGPCAFGLAPDIHQARRSLARLAAWRRRQGVRARLMAGRLAQGPCPPQHPR